MINFYLLSVYLSLLDFNLLTDFCFLSHSTGDHLILSSSPPLCFCLLLRLLPPPPPIGSSSSGSSFQSSTAASACARARSAHARRATHTRRGAHSSGAVAATVAVNYRSGSNSGGATPRARLHKTRLLCAPVPIRSSRCRRRCLGRLVAASPTLPPQSPQSRARSIPAPRSSALGARRSQAARSELALEGEPSPTAPPSGSEERGCWRLSLARSLALNGLAGGAIMTRALIQ